MLSALLPLGRTLLEGVGGFVRRRQERRAAGESAASKLRQGAQDDAHARELAGQLSRAEWEAIGRRAESETWKDEYVTVLVTLPLLTLFLGALLEAFGVPEVSAAGRAMIDTLNGLDGPYADLVTYTVLAAIGIRAVRGIR